MEANFDILKGFQSGSEYNLGLEQHSLGSQLGPTNMVQPTSLGLGLTSQLTGAPLLN